MYIIKRRYLHQNPAHSLEVSKTPEREFVKKDVLTSPKSDPETSPQSSFEENPIGAENPVVERAHELLKRGFMPIPIWYDEQQNKLIPKGIVWNKEPFVHSETVEETWEKIKEEFRTAEGIAIKCGEISNLIVIDVDDPEKFNEFYPIDKLRKEANYVIRSRTPGRFHFGFAYEEEFSSYKNFTKVAGFELQTNGRPINIYSAYPGITYTPEKFEMQKPMPEELKKRIRDLMAGRKGRSSSTVAGQPGKHPEDYREIAVKTLEILEPYYCKGQRHFFVMYVAGTLRKLGVPEEIAREELKAFCEDRRDEEIPMRLSAIKTTYAKPKDDISGVKGLRETLGVSEEEISKIFALAGKQDPKQEPFSLEMWTARQLTNAEFPSPEWLIYGVLPEGLSLLSGKPKVGKSWLALSFCIEVARTTGRPVLYFGLEDTKGRLKDRLLTLDGGDLENLYVVPKSPRLDRGGWTHIAEICNAHRPILVVIDPWVRFKPQVDTHKRNHDPYATDYENIALFKQLTEDGINVLIVHHKRKAESVDPLDEVLGTTGITGAVDNILSLKRQRGSKSGLLEVIARDFEERSWGLSFENGKWTFLGEGEEFFVAEEQKKIVEAIRKLGGKASPKQVAEYLGKNYHTVKNQMQKMFEKGILKKDTKGIFLSDDRLVNSLSSLSSLSSPEVKTPELKTIETIVYSSMSSRTKSAPDLASQGKDYCDYCDYSDHIVAPNSSFATETETKGEEEILVFMPRDEDRCKICNKSTVWRVKQRVYKKGSGCAHCAKCNYVAWFGSFTGGTIISKERLNDYLSPTPSNESGKDPSLEDPGDVNEIPF